MVAYPTGVQGRFIERRFYSRVGQPHSTDGEILRGLMIHQVRPGPAHGKIRGQVWGGERSNDDSGVV